MLALVLTSSTVAVFPTQLLHLSAADFFHDTGPLSLCLTLYKREVDSLDEGQLQLCQISSLAVPGTPARTSYLNRKIAMPFCCSALCLAGWPAGLDSLGKQQTPDRWLSLGSVS